MGLPKYTGASSPPGRSPLTAALPLRCAEAEVAELTEEFARRLASAERAAQAVQDERDDLRARLRSVTQGGSANESRLAEKEEYIRGLQ